MKNSFYFKIILASASPRRQELLNKYGISFEVLVTDIDETVNKVMLPTDFVSVISKHKAEAAVSKILNETPQIPTIVIAADTVVAINGRILGKPTDTGDAFAMLKVLEGKRHSVYTGLTVVFIENDNLTYKQDVCVTEVKFKPLTDREIQAYIDTGEPFDKAGAYAIQGIGGKFIEKIEGSYDNVVGLPMEKLMKMLNNEELFMPLTDEQIDYK